MSHLFRFDKSQKGVQVIRSQVDRDCRLFGNIRVYQSEIYSGTRILTDNFALSIISDSTISNSTISACPVIRDSYITGSELIGSSIAHSLIEPNSIIHNSKLYNVRLGVKCVIDTAFIEPDALSVSDAEAVRIPDHARMTGYWSRAPLVRLIKDFDSVTEAQEHECFVGCKLRPTEHWLNNSAKYFRRLGIKSETSDAILEAVKAVREFQLNQ